MAMNNLLYILAAPVDRSFKRHRSQRIIYIMIIQRGEAFACEPNSSIGGMLHYKPSVHDIIAHEKLELIAIFTLVLTEDR